MQISRIALLGTLSELHRQPIHFDLAEVGRILTEVQPDLLGVEVEPDEFERGDLRRAPVEVREALVPVARRSDSVIVPIGAGSPDELRPELRALSAFIVRALDATLEAVQQTAGDARGVNSALVSHTCGFICHLEQAACGERGREAWTSTNEWMLEHIRAMIERDPGRRILVAVQCRRKHWLEPKLRKSVAVELVNYWEL